jgi:hypothetical protein
VPEPKPRYLLVIKPLDQEVAESSRRETIRCLEAEIAERQTMIRDLLNQHLPTTTEEYIQIFPGDPRYAQADDKFDPNKYRGTWKFQTIIPVSDLP